VTDTKELLRSAIGTGEPQVPPIEGVVRRAGSHRRRERIVAAVLALTLTAGMGTGLALLLRGGDGDRRPSEGVTVVGPTRQIYIPSESMTPTLQVGDTVLVDEGAYLASAGLPARGDIIAFTDPTTEQDFDFVKRVVGLPGDTVEQHDGAIYVNGALFTMPQRDRPSVTLGPFEVGPGRVFVVGDHLENSNDSRYGIGQVPLDNVIGKVVEILSPSDRRATVAPPTAKTARGPGDGG
jgi:signal peptidase I